MGGSWTLWLAESWLGTPIWAWLVFFALVAALLVFDLGVLHRKDRAIPVKESLYLSAGYIVVALAFGSWVWVYLGARDGLDFFTGYLVEKSLSVDNIFVIALIFSSMAIPRELQHRVLFWGILGVILLRGLMIGLGAALIHQFAWILFVFGAFLVLTGIKMLLIPDEHPVNLDDNRLLRFLRTHLRVTPDLRGRHFLVRERDPASGALRVWATPLLVALILIECADVVFAVDSVPAVFAITQDPFVVYTSNIFAILGLRALYFALAAVIHRFHYLKFALALVLVFIGGKIFLAELIGKVPAAVSLGVTFGLLAGGIAYSIYRTRAEPPAVAPPPVGKASTLGAGG